MQTPGKRSFDFDASRWAFFVLLTIRSAAVRELNKNARLLFSQTQPRNARNPSPPPNVSGHLPFCQFILPLSGCSVLAASVVKYAPVPRPLNATTRPYLYGSTRARSAPATSFGNSFIFATNCRTVLPATWPPVFRSSLAVRGATVIPMFPSLVPGVLNRFANLAHTHRAAFGGYYI